MARREQLQEAYEDALFALLMEDFAQEEGQLLAEQKPEAAVSSALDERCRRSIRQNFARQRWKRRAQAAGQIVRRAAMFVAVMMALFATAYAAFPEVRVRALNLLIERSELSTTLMLDGVYGEPCSPGRTATDEEGRKILMGYRLPETPEGFTVKFEGNNSVAAWIQYTSNSGETIMVSVDPAEGSSVLVDTQNAQNVEEIQIQGFDGLLIEKDDRVDITWADTDHLQYVSVLCNGVAKEFALRYANAITFEENTK